MGQASWVFGFAGNVGFSAFRCGEWELSRTELETALQDAVDPSDRSLLLNNLVNLQAVTGDPHGAAMTELEEIVRALPEGGWESLVQECRGWIGLAAGRFAEAATAWRAGTEVGELAVVAGYAMAARAALWARDIAAAQADVDRLIRAGVHGPAIDASLAAFEAGIAGLEGRVADALAGYRTANAAWRAIDLPWDQALTAIDMAHVLGPAVPDVRAAAGDAREILARLGARPFLAQLDAIIGPADEEAAAATGRPAEGDDAGVALATADASGPPA